MWFQIYKKKKNLQNYFFKQLFENLDFKGINLGRGARLRIENKN